MWWLFVKYLECVVVVWFLFGLVLYVEERRGRIRRHAVSPWTMAAKLLLAPLTLAFVSADIMGMPIAYLWTRRTAGCFAGNRPPVYVPELQETHDRLSAILEKCDDAIAVPPDGLRLTGHNGRKVATLYPPSCGRATIECAIKNTFGPSSLVRDDAVEEALCH